MPKKPRRMIKSSKCPRSLIWILPLNMATDIIITVPDGATRVTVIIGRNGETMVAIMVTNRPAITEIMAATTRATTLTTAISHTADITAIIRRAIMVDITQNIPMVATGDTIRAVVTKRNGRGTKLTAVTTITDLSTATMDIIITAIIQIIMASMITETTAITRTVITSITMTGTRAVTDIIILAMAAMAATRAGTDMAISTMVVITVVMDMVATKSKLVVINIRSNYASCIHNFWPVLFCC